MSCATRVSRLRSSTTWRNVEGSYATFTSPDFIQLVQDWIDGDVANYGLYFIKQGSFSASNNIYFGTREGLESQRPILFIEVETKVVAAPEPSTLALAALATLWVTARTKRRRE
jgi:hypothetical protein